MLYVYPSKSRADTIIHVPTTLEDLKKVCENHDGGPLDDARLLLGGSLFSRKEISHTAHKTKPWHIVNNIDDTTQLLSDAEMATDTHIVTAMGRNALIVATPIVACKCERLAFPTTN